MDVKIISAEDAETFDVLGIPHTVLVEGQDNEGNYEVLEITGDPGMGVPLHVHKHEDETFYVAEGEVAFLTSEGEKIGAAGTCVNLPRGVAHGYRIVAPDSRMVLTISPGRLIPMFRGLSELPPGEPDLEQVSTVINEFDVSFL